MDDYKFQGQCTSSLGRITEKSELRAYVLMKSEGGNITNKCAAMGNYAGWGIKRTNNKEKKGAGDLYETWVFHPRPHL
jgi:hypothetical protein